MNNTVSSFRVDIPNEGKAFILNKIEQVIESGTGWTDGRFVAEFEDAFGINYGTKYNVAVNSGISAIQAAIYALGLDEKDCVAYVPTLTAPPTPLGCLYSGMKVVFVDSKKDDLGMDPVDLEDKIKKYPSRKGLIMPVHISGIISPNIDKIIEIAREHNMCTIEDCAHAHGAVFNGIEAGMRADAGIFSFFMTKVLMSGEGGLVITQDCEIYKKCKIVRNYGKIKGVYTLRGSNWRMSEFNAIVALWQTLDSQRILNQRRAIAAQYDKNLQVSGFNIIHIPKNSKSSYYKYVLYLDKEIIRDKFLEILRREYNVTLPSEVYKFPCHKEPVFNSFANIMNLDDSFPQSIEIANSQICLPLYPGLKNDEVEYIINSLLSTLQKF